MDLDMDMDMQHGHGHPAWTWTCNKDKNKLLVHANTHDECPYCMTMLHADVLVNVHVAYPCLRRMSQYTLHVLSML
jgi:hypothetical protein